MTRASRVLGIAVALALLGLTAAAQAPERDTSPEGIMKRLLTALEVNNYTGFVSEGDAEFEAGFTRYMVETMGLQLGRRMKKGYDLQLLGELKQQGCMVYLWKMTYKDGLDDALIKLVLRGGKVAAFWIQ
ncbi:MAG: hypothetical protein V1873_06690 [Verrucomicrobiota bacterium]